MKILVVTPYAPTQIHGHAADDIGSDFYGALGDLVELHVYAPGQGAGQSKGAMPGQTYKTHASRSARKSAFRHVGVYPAAGRKDWSRANTREVLRLVDAIQPDHVHFEYLQSVEPALRLPRSISWSITLHDISAKVMRQRAASSRLVERPYRYLEYARTARTESTTIRRAGSVFVLSERDAEATSDLAGRAHVFRLGSTPSTDVWTPPQNNTPTLVFAGAMWRDANCVVATYLVEDVMPAVWRTIPAANLRIVGTRPARAVRELSSDRVVVTGEVESLEMEYLSADVVLAPTIYDAGVLLKAKRALACGAPLVLNESAAAPLHLINESEALIEDDPEEMARAIVRLIQSPELAAELGRGGRAKFQETPSWSVVASDFLNVIRGAR